MHEVIADGPLQTDQYYSVGKVTEFNGCYFVQCIRGGDLNCLYNFGTYCLFFLYPINEELLSLVIQDTL